MITPLHWLPTEEIKLSWATSSISWLNNKQAKISSTISILIIRELTISVCIIYRVYLKCLDKLQELIPQNKVHTYICPEISVVFVVTERLHSTTNTLNV
jgi:hypothetical protein